LERIGRMPRAFVLDFGAVPLVDATAAKGLEAFAHRLKTHGSTLFIAAARLPVRRSLMKAGLREPHVRYVATVDEARAEAAQPQPVG
ncbi:MAG TPA: sodium-independent anion transporter, partial [Pirellulaceae bacterium]|nr:sodium-independent anion transporter [Pirellulaceae bacterium]